MRSMVVGVSATADILQAPWTTEEHGPAAGTISKPDKSDVFIHCHDERYIFKPGVFSHREYGIVEVEENIILFRYLWCFGNTGLPI